MDHDGKSQLAAQLAKIERELRRKERKLEKYNRVLKAKKHVQDTLQRHSAASQGTPGSASPLVQDTPLPALRPSGGRSVTFSTAAPEVVYVSQQCGTPGGREVHHEHPPPSLCHAEQETTSEAQTEGEPRVPGLFLNSSEVPGPETGPGDCESGTNIVQDSHFSSSTGLSRAKPNSEHAVGCVGSPVASPRVGAVESGSGPPEWSPRSPWCAGRLGQVTTPTGERKQHSPELFSTQRHPNEGGVRRHCVSQQRWRSRASVSVTEGLDSSTSRGEKSECLGVRRLTQNKSISHTSRDTLREDMRGGDTMGAMGVDQSCTTPLFQPGLRNDTEEKCPLEKIAAPISESETDRMCLEACWHAEEMNENGSVGGENDVKEESGVEARTMEKLWSQRISLGSGGSSVAQGLGKSALGGVSGIFLGAVEGHLSSDTPQKIKSMEVDETNNKPSHVENTEGMVMNQEVKRIKMQSSDLEDVCLGEVTVPAAPTRDPTVLLEWPVQGAEVSVWTTPARERHGTPLTTSLTSTGNTCCLLVVHEGGLVLWRSPAGTGEDWRVVGEAQHKIGAASEIRSLCTVGLPSGEEEARFLVLVQKETVEVVYAQLALCGEEWLITAATLSQPACPVEGLSACAVGEWCTAICWALKEPSPGTGTLTLLDFDVTYSRRGRQWELLCHPASRRLPSGGEHRPCIASLNTQTGPSGLLVCGSDSGVILFDPWHCTVISRIPWSGPGLAWTQAVEDLLFVVWQGSSSPLQISLSAVNPLNGLHDTFLSLKIPNTGTPATSPPTGVGCLDRVTGVSFQQDSIIMCLSSGCIINILLKIK